MWLVRSSGGLTRNAGSDKAQAPPLCVCGQNTQRRTRRYRGGSPVGRSRLHRAHRAVLQGPDTFCGPDETAGPWYESVLLWYMYIVVQQYTVTRPIAELHLKPVWGRWPSTTFQSWIHLAMTPTTTRHSNLRRRGLLHGSTVCPVRLLARHTHGVPSQTNTSHGSIH